MKPTRRVKRRRGKPFIFKDGKWVPVKPELLPEEAGAQTPPSDSPRELARQISGAKEARWLLAFLKVAATSPAFGASHTALAVHALAVVRGSLSALDLQGLRSSEVLDGLAARGRELLRGEEAQALTPALVAQALRSVALYRRDAPQLLLLVEPLAALATQAAGEMNSRQVSQLVWAVAELRGHAPALQDELLPLVATKQRLASARSFLQRHAREECAKLDMAVLKLKQEVPYLRQVLAL